MKMASVQSSRAEDVIYQSFSAPTNAVTQVFELPSGTYAGFTMATAFTPVFTGGGNLPNNPISKGITSMELSVGGVQQWRLTQDQLATFALYVYAQKPSVNAPLAGDAAAGAQTIPADCTIFSDIGATATGVLSESNYTVMAGYSGNDARLEVTFDGSILANSLSAAGAFTSLNLSMDVCMIAGAPSVGRVDIFEQTAETRNDIQINQTASAVLVNTTTADDLTQIETPSYNYTTMSLIKGNWSQVNGANSVVETKWYYIKRPFSPGIISVLGNTAENRTVYVSYLPGSNLTGSGQAATIAQVVSNQRTGSGPSTSLMGGFLGRRLNTLGRRF